MNEVADLLAQLAEAKDELSTAKYVLNEGEIRRAQLVARAQAAEAALREVVAALGGGACKANKCDGCRAEMELAASAARRCLEQVAR